MQGFRGWLAQFEQPPTSLGDLARLAVGDPAWPDGPDRSRIYTDYMERAGASPAALQTFIDAWILYAATHEEAPTAPSTEH
ncbi:YozE family protein [Streptomyces sp. NPDC028635]|uniref:YozE family protein n=1 Tax=Streptomyces sp. NPDC028635 TaxID=3154800 RepID=UPI0033CA59E3